MSDFFKVSKASWHLSVQSPNVCFLSFCKRNLVEHIFLKNLSQIFCSNWPNPENFLIVFDFFVPQMIKSFQFLKYTPQLHSLLSCDTDR